ncbi:MAG: c-type cytochrome [Deltaproteobacteria bacterium]|nr:MAG: c-type cytochrome [Deltaproteobacteria bacterium]
MKKLLFITALSLAIIPLHLTPQASAADTKNGAKVFGSYCAGCHRHGGNIVNPEKTLKKEALEKSGKASAEAIKRQVTNGAGAMPAFKTSLSDKQIEDVVAYVLEQAEKGW